MAEDSERTEEVLDRGDRLLAASRRLLREVERQLQSIDQVPVPPVEPTA